MTVAFVSAITLAVALPAVGGFPGTCEGESDDVASFISSAHLAASQLRTTDRSGSSTSDSSEAAEGRAEHPVDVGWFGGGFAESESTFSQDAVGSHLDFNPERLVANGRDPETRVPTSGVPQARSMEWFHESPSAAAFDAWQTDHSVDHSIVGSDKRAASNKWRYTPEGWTQDYARAAMHEAPGPKAPGWFDSSVAQFDGFGRRKAPNVGSGARLSSWTERSVNTTLACAEPGCMAASTLQAFDGATEIGSNCKLTIYVHPTDFDDDYGAEAVEYLKANGRVLTHNCNPGARGCNASAANPYYSCANAVDVDGIVGSDGALLIEGKITDRVDECPIDGNLLSGVAMVTCMVTPITTTTTTTTVPLVQLGRSPNNASAPLVCNTPGCVGTANLFFDPYFAERGGTCTLSLEVAQTDFDQNNGVVEVIDYIKVEGQDVATEVAPGKNPCVAAFEGSPLSPADRQFTVLNKQDVTAQVLSATFKGRLLITGKISDAVDECGTAQDGALLDGMAFLECSPPAGEVAPEVLTEASLLDLD